MVNLADKAPEFSSLPGDPSKAYTTYGPEKTEASFNPKDAPKASADEGEDDDDLFGSGDESEDEEAKKKREEKLSAYKKSKEGKTKPAAKSIVTLDVKPWGMCIFLSQAPSSKIVLIRYKQQTTKRTWSNSRRT